MPGPGRILRPTEGTNAPRAITRRDARNVPWRYVRPPGSPRSDFITTRCYAADGRQIWDADHGSDVHSLCVDSAGCVYQSGVPTNYDLGDSLFHKVADGISAIPLVTKLGSHGAKRWAVKRADASTFLSYGICITPANDLYVARNKAGGAAPGSITKINATTGAEGIELPTSGFNLTATGSGGTVGGPNIQFGRIRSDGSGNIHAYSTILAAVRGEVPRIYRWASDAVDAVIVNSVNGPIVYTGLGVDSAGNIASSHRQSPGFVRYVLGRIWGPDPSDVPSAGDATILANVEGPITVEPNEHSYLGIGMSPNGRVITKYRETDEVISIAVGGAITVLCTTPDLAVQVFGGAGSFDAIAINDDGVYAYSVDQPSNGYSHEIRAADNSLIAQPNHGGQIFDCAVLPDGKVIVAGERVARADFP